LEKLAFGRFSDISFVAAGYAPRAKGVTFAGCAHHGPTSASPTGC
jgi:hypothetical protein